jgi:serine/threonine protein kinase
MGEVYEAIDTRNGQRVALKKLFEIDPTGVYRLKREFRRMADVAHENLISLYELHSDHDCWFFTMELLAGTDLMTAMVAALAGGYDALRPLVRQLVRGVHALHQAGRIHRDLKPSNVMVTAEGRVVILDFGLVNEIDHRTLFASTRGLIRGTPLFMAPEQCAGQLATPAADWYAVGVILFEALTGRYPFERGVMEIVLDKQEQDAPRLSTLVPRIPRELDDLVAALLRRVPSERAGVHELLTWCAGGRANISLRLAPRRPSDGVLLEREAQTKALRDAFDRTVGGNPTCVDVVGEAGSCSCPSARRRRSSTTWARASTRCP